MKWRNLIGTRDEWLWRSCVNGDGSADGEQPEWFLILGLSLLVIALFVVFGQ